MGSKYLADEGYTPYEILTNFYGTNLDLVTAKEVKGIPISYPGIALKVGSRGSDVRNIQKYLNTISKNYPAIPKVSEDGIYGNATRDAVKNFKRYLMLMYQVLLSMIPGMRFLMSMLQ